MSVAKAAVAAVSLGFVLTGCSTLPNNLRPESCPDLPGMGVTSNAVEDGTRGASGTSSTSNGTGSTIDPTAPPCH